MNLFACALLALPGPSNKRDKLKGGFDGGRLPGLYQPAMQGRSLACLL